MQKGVLLCVLVVLFGCALLGVNAQGSSSTGDEFDSSGGSVSSTGDEFDSSAGSISSTGDEFDSSAGSVSSSTADVATDQLSNTTSEFYNPDGLHTGAEHGLMILGVSISFLVLFTVSVLLASSASYGGAAAKLSSESHRSPSVSVNIKSSRSSSVEPRGNSRGTLKHEHNLRSVTPGGYERRRQRDVTADEVASMLAL